MRTEICSNPCSTPNVTLPFVFQVPTTKSVWLQFSPTKAFCLQPSGSHPTNSVGTIIDCDHGRYWQHRIPKGQRFVLENEV